MEVVERECLLFEAGAYPDRGVTITPDDLAAIAENTPGEIPVKIEHLRESPFDGALGVVTKLRAVGGQLWGTLRQPAEAWRFVQRAGARALSVALDVAGRRLVETSFVCRPRVASAQVFGAYPPAPSRKREGVSVPSAVGSGEEVSMGECVVFEADLFEGKEGGMTGVRQFAEGLIQHLRGALGGMDDSGGPEAARFADERAALAAEREAVAAERVEQQVAALKRKGLLRSAEPAEGMARAILQFGVTNVVQFGGEETPVGALFARFLEANGPVVPMGELAFADPAQGGRAAERLIAQARETARRDNIGYLAAFAQVSNAHPDLARAAREEGFGA